MKCVGDVLHWRDLQVHEQILPADHICRGEHVRLVMSNSMQYMLLNLFFPKVLSHGSDDPQVWLQREGEMIAAGASDFCLHVGGMIRQRGLLANLTMRENLLLPFLYLENKKRLKQAEAEVEEVAKFLGLDEVLDVQAGERSTFTHALVSLGHCILKKPDVIVVQEVHVGMEPDRLEVFRAKVHEVMQEYGAGILYVTSSLHEGSGLEFARTYEIDCDDAPELSGVW